VYICTPIFLIFLQLKSRYSHRKWNRDLGWDCPTEALSEYLEAADLTNSVKPQLNSVQERPGPLSRAALFHSSVGCALAWRHWFWIWSSRFCPESSWVQKHGLELCFCTTFIGFVVSCPVSLLFFFFFFGGTGVWTELCKLPLYHLRDNLSHTSSPVCSAYFGDVVSHTVCLGWPWTSILLISASQEARITSVSHGCPALILASYL
jgi:hypothetical protein